MILLLHRWPLVYYAVARLTNNQITWSRTLEQGLDYARELDFDCAVIEPLQFPGAVKKLSKRFPVIVLTESKKDHDVLRAIQDGAFAYLHLSCGMDQLAHQIKSAPMGSPALTAAQLRILLTELEQLRNNNPTANITSRQLELLRLICEGKTNTQIAKEMGIRTGSVRALVSELYKRLELPSGDKRVLAVLWTIRHKLMEL